MPSLGKRAEDVDWVLALGELESRAAVMETESPLSPLLTPASPPPPVSSMRVVLECFEAPYIKNALSAASSPGELESIVKQVFEFTTRDQTSQAISRELLELGKLVLDANARVGLEFFIAPLVWNESQSQFPSETLAERLVLQHKLDDRMVNLLAQTLLQPGSRGGGRQRHDFSDLELGFWQRCILPRSLLPAVLDLFLSKLDASSHTRLLASLVFTLIKSNKAALQPHVSTIKCILARSPSDGAMLFPAKRAFAQLESTMTTTT